VSRPLRAAASSAHRPTMNCPQAAQQYLAQAGYAGQVRLGRDRIGDRVDVSVTWSQRGLFTSFVGVGQYGGTVQASAYSSHGVALEEGC
jgi:hypothetical protein